MKRTSTMLALVLSVAACVPVAAAPAGPVRQFTLSISSPAVLPVANSVIPARTAIVVRFPQEQAVDVGISRSTPLTLPLAQPVYDAVGNLVIPADAIATIEVRPIDGGAVLVARSLVVRGKVLEINAVSAHLPGQVHTRTNGSKVAAENAPVITRIGATLLGVIGGGSMESLETGALLGTALGALGGLSSPESVRLVQFPSGSLHVLTLEDAVLLPSVPLLRPRG